VNFLNISASAWVNLLNADSASGRFRPDGYGCYRRGCAVRFFLEFDRGTVKPREYAAKLEASIGIATPARQSVATPVSLRCWS